ncbi:hypothetical protein [Paracoccus siganidrum]|uniref:Uncharacterized protein n=2 Tax=Paracoccus siganidrum TaxID=1276757 RepID=A0A419A8E7_9RHOB|nr:hypothetical protein [Paracoccus siganidrum]RJL18198.1 hypothetical protein D3P05_07585 [Paracoccus siganidrum]RMC33375.1 hypothetical protein C9E82_13045 [Paracoccus siganidrum]
MTISEFMQVALAIASVGLAAFCMILARRLRRLNDLETGLGGAIAVMAAEVDRLEKAICAARDEATAAGEALAAEITRARTERAAWELRQRIGQAAGIEAPARRAPRLRKRMEQADA